MATTLSARTVPSRGGSRLDEASRASLIGVGCVLGLGAVGTVGAAAVGPRVDYLVVVLAAGTAVRLVTRPKAYVSFVLWVWLLTPLLRRLLDLRIGFNLDNPVFLAPPAVLLPGTLLALFRPRRRVVPALSTPLTCALLTVAYGTAVGFVLNGGTATAAGFVAWAPPLLFALYLAVEGPDKEDLLPVLSLTMWLAAVVLGVYGLVQWAVLPPWDKAWLDGVQLTSQGLAEPRELRVFSTLNSTGPFASVMGATLLVAGNAYRSRWRQAALLPGYAAFLLTLVRSAWIGLAVAVLIGLAVGLVRLRAVLVALLIATLAVVIIGGPAVTVVQDRLSRSVQAGSSDTSASARLQFHREALPVVARELQGQGVGGVGNSSRLRDAGPDGGLPRANIDSGLIETCLTLGWFAGVLYLGGLVSGLVRLVRRRSLDSGAATGWSLAAISIAVQLPFGNGLVGVSGLFLWLGLTVLGRTPPLDVSTLARRA